MEETFISMTAVFCIQNSSSSFRLSAILKRLREDIRQKWEELDSSLWQRALSSSLPTHEFLAKDNIVSLSHPPYYPDLAPAEFHLVSKMNRQLNGHRFNTVVEIKDKIMFQLLIRVTILKFIFLFLYSINCNFSSNWLT